MASLAIHLAVANEYLKRTNVKEPYKVKDVSSFLRGVKDPDIIALQGREQKEKAHYTDTRNFKMPLLQRFTKKVNLYRYLSENKIDTDYELGYYCHLLTDYFFFNCFLYKPEIEKYDFKDLYSDYERIAKQMEEEYKVDNSNTPWAGIYRDGEPKLFTRDELKQFIAVCATIDYGNLNEIILANKNMWRENAKSIYNDTIKTIH